MAQTALVVLTTLANDADARALVTALVAARLVACGTLLPGARSIYRWEGQLTEEASGGPAEDGCVEVGSAVRRRPGAASIPGAGVAGVAGRAGAGALPLLAHARGGRVIRKRETRWQSAAERARVAAELIEEAESLTETSSIASPADVARARLPPPITAQLPSSPPAAPPGDAPAPAGPAEPTLDDPLAADPDNVAL